MTAPICASALGAIAGALLGGPWIWLHYLCKPLATVLLLAMAARAAQPVAMRYRTLVCAGLVLSLAGDVFLMLPIDLFVAGLLSFLLAHLCYIAAFAGGSSWSARALALLAYAAIAAANLTALLPHVPADLKPAVLGYVAVLVLMAAMAGARAWSLRGDALAKPARVAAVGGALFVVSDSLLAWDKFGGGIPEAALFVLASYYAAQWCIARSVDRAKSEEVRRG
ncbi:MAG TPA: lysoplasmalogenase [Xanthomonadaceae bacterium]